MVCDGDSYFTELVRYIHLNPLRVELVKDLRQLERYPYCGHGTILGTQSNAWQDRDSVLAQFSQREAEAKEAYRRYIAEGVVLGRRPELVGGSGSVGEWFAVKSQRQRRIEESTDERILGSGAFVERVLIEADARTLRQNAFKKNKTLCGACRCIKNARPLEADVVGGLVSGLARGGISDEQLLTIQEILKKKDGGGA